MDASCFAPRLAGVLPAVPTPFRCDGVDIGAFGDYCERLVARRVAGLVACGTTGEATSLSDGEYWDVLHAAVSASRGRIPVIAGVPGTATAAVIARARAAEAAGVDALLLAAPPYVRPSQSGLILHVTAVHDATGLPIVLHDVPSRTAVPFACETIASLADLPRVVGIEDASRDLARPVRIRAAAGPAFVQISGDDATVAAHLAQGGIGCISVTANVAPRACCALVAAWQRGDRYDLMRLRDALDPLHTALSAETNPVPVKAALAVLGLMPADPRLPLVAASRETRDTVARALETVMAIESELDGLDQGGSRGAPPEVHWQEVFATSRERVCCRS